MVINETTGTGNLLSPCENNFRMFLLFCTFSVHVKTLGHVKRSPVVLVYSLVFYFYRFMEDTV